MSRVYLDWNATAPLRPEARAAMLEAMDVVGNPSSVHAEGRAAKAIVEKARGQVARLVGCDLAEIVFTSGATEAAALWAKNFGIGCAPATEHDCIAVHAQRMLPVNRHGVFDYDQNAVMDASERGFSAVQSANSETGVLQPVADWMDSTPHVIDAVQSVGKPGFCFRSTSAECLLVSAHKFGGPKGVGALVRNEFPVFEVKAMLRGGGQEMGRRSGTENVIGIAGFGAAAEAAQRDLEDGVWDWVEKLRNILEEALASASKDTIFVGKEVARLPNTSCVMTPGWKGETQVMQMDLAGYAISAGSACSSGKVKESRVLRAMGFDEVSASSAIRVSLGPTTTEEEVLGFARAWEEHYRRWQNRRAA